MRINKPTKLITFDTYGTLIDWDAGLAEYLRPLLAERGWTATPREFYQTWYNGFALRAVRDEPYRPYRQLLQETLKAALATLGLEVRDEDGADFGSAMAESQPFDDAIEMLRELRKSYKVATISNSQHDILRRSSELMENPFDAMFTAEDTLAYKPNTKLLDLAIDHFGVSKDEVVHVGQAQFVDLPMSIPMGVTTVWINRQSQELAGGTPEPDAVLPDVRDLPDLLAAANREYECQN